MLLAFAGAAALAACGGAATPGPAAPGEDHDHTHMSGEDPEEMHHEPHEGMTGSLHELHELLAPVYHLEKGADRSTKACAATGSFRAKATKVEAEPKGEPAAWKAKTDAFVGAVDALETACKAPGQADVDAGLEKVHDAFHALVDAH